MSNLLEKVGRGVLAALLASAAVILGMLVVLCSGVGLVALFLGQFGAVAVYAFADAVFLAGFLSVAARTWRTARGQDSLVENKRTGRLARFLPFACFGTFVGLGYVTGGYLFFDTKGTDLQAFAVMLIIAVVVSVLLAVWDALFGDVEGLL
jgi:hypothetical protein